MYYLRSYSSNGTLAEFFSFPAAVSRFSCFSWVQDTIVLLRLFPFNDSHDYNRKFRRRLPDHCSKPQNTLHQLGLIPDRLPYPFLANMSKSAHQMFLVFLKCHSIQQFGFLGVPQQYSSLVFLKCYSSTAVAVHAPPLISSTSH